MIDVMDNRDGDGGGAQLRTEHRWFNIPLADLRRVAAELIQLVEKDQYERTMVGSQRYTFNGRVKREEDDIPIAGASVVVRIDRRRNKRIELISDEHGYFKVPDGLPAGTYDVFVTAEGRHQLKMQVTFPAPGLGLWQNVRLRRLAWPPMADCALIDSE